MLMIRRGALVALIAVALSGCQVGYWRMNELSGTVVHDSGGGGHDGTSKNVSLGQPGHDGTAYGFNGNSSIVRVPHSSDLNPGDGDFSYGAWVKFTAVPPPTTFDVIRKGVSESQGGDYKLELFRANDAAKARCYAKGSGGSDGITGGNNLNDGQWHQLTCERFGSSWRITVDGVTTSENASIGRIANTADVTIGAKPTNEDWFDGLIDDAFIAIG
jgi:hypothetical protein